MNANRNDDDNIRELIKGAHVGLPKPQHTFLQTVAIARDRNTKAKSERKWIFPLSMAGALGAVTFIVFSLTRTAVQEPSWDLQSIQSVEKFETAADENLIAFESITQDASTGFDLGRALESKNLFGKEEML